MRILSPEAVVLKDRGGGSFPLSSYLPMFGSHSWDSFVYAKSL